MIAHHHGCHQAVGTSPPGSSRRGEGYALPLGPRGLSALALVPFPTVFFPARVDGRRRLHRVRGLGVGALRRHQVRWVSVQGV